MSLNEVRKIAVLRPNAVGDFVFVLPALHTLKHRYPDAELVLLGKPWHAGFLRDRPGPVDRVAVMPPVPGVGAPVGAACDEREVDRFVDAMRAECFDIALQMFGAGHYSNPFLMRLGARLSVGARGEGAPALERWVPYCEPNNRRLALLEIAGLVDAWPGTPPLPSLPPMPELTVTDADRREAAAAMPAAVAAAAFGTGERLALLQPGATDLRRCWPAERFAALGDRLAQAGMRVAVNGAAGEAALVGAVVGAMRHPAIALAGKLSLGGLCGLLERAALVVSNDTGPLHLALALGRPSVGIFWLTNLIEGMPLRQSPLRAALSLRTCCPVCGRDNVATRCPHDESFVADVGLEQVAHLALSLLR
ncbi:glycosyltransferase family 9 protein [Massilia sp. LXY-6]|uniref:glycosyltransferase family 9 protein n=1 Tax=Massilia sp. LXY-6 TaxID=3379823 RepID=UPI003EDF6D0C